MSKNLVIVESPAKAKTIEGYLGKGFTVKSSFGHVRDIPKKGMGIDIENDFNPNYEVSEDKKKVVAELIKLTKASDIVWLATDEDREGEAISWHLYETLGLDKKETKRITFNEITKTAVQNAIENPREINIDLVNAQQARRVLDRLVGFELSPVLWKKIKPSLSAGRVQSVTVRLIVEREREIRGFESSAAYKVKAEFVLDGTVIKSDLGKTFKTEEETLIFLNQCKDSDFKIDDIQKKPAKKSPAPPFTTSTLQQEASRKLGYSVSRTMSVAQKLYEAGRITYMRTDSINLSQTARNGAKAEIVKSYGDDFSFPRVFKTKTKGAQEAHEAIRPSSFAVHSAGTDSSENRLYELIWKRAIASQMSEALLEKTTVKVAGSKISELFTARGEIIKFEGFLKVYLEGKDDENEDLESENEGIFPPMNVGDAVSKKIIEATQRYTRPPARFSEAALVKKLEELGIGRPSTYAPTITTVQKRGYVSKEEIDYKSRNYGQLTLKNGKIETKELSENFGGDKNKLHPTDIGTVVNDFLVENFDGILDYNFTASVEKEFDDIAEGLLKWTDMIKKFYNPFHTKVEHTLEHGERQSGERVLGKTEEGEDILVRIGRFGPMAQIGRTLEDEDAPKPKFSSLQPNQSISTISLEEVIDLFKLPKDLGIYEGSDVIVSNGRFGPYIKHNEKFVSIPKGEDPMNVDLARATELIIEKEKADAPIYEYEGLPVQKGSGRFGPFIKWNEIFINVNKKYDHDNLSDEDIVELIEVKKQKEIDKVIHNWEEEGIRVEKARWGRFNVLKGKTKIELPKTTKAEELTLEEVKAMIEKAKPAKKKAKPKAKAKAKPKAKKK
ncbi:MAG: DNA topoisomerase-1 [Urechidicola sp.]|jgi:DNA topoisomerase-1|tara:strand:+ start:23169 stop:25691 length:2523 start_codon:yes stop_codon:yes gene_type:complete